MNREIIVFRPRKCSVKIIDTIEIVYRWSGNKTFLFQRSLKSNSIIWSVVCAKHFLIRDHSTTTTLSNLVLSVQVQSNVFYLLWAPSRYIFPFQQLFDWSSQSLIFSEHPIYLCKLLLSLSEGTSASGFLKNLGYHHESS